MKFKIIGCILVTIVAILAYIVFSGGKTSNDTNTEFGTETEVQYQ